ncbi:hypothetical protein CYLTODRAFT_403032 [Cylindrobasidium torrendii FP15055 ss-10]|uniref:Uncharacterized protein n=1 Tax=Cylindrobasidium torrendii FP15055 ss-10 TaxID=1314674 RepID=A0A0D7AYX6_9AGAR|nr:hypothetical protein CYLTODRAFT_403032 [Cylindrobasidium torrendii FP15055 ss-10]
MSEVAVINIDKREVLDPSDQCSSSWGYGFKAKEAIANNMPVDLIWLFTVPVDGQTVPPIASPVYKKSRGRTPAGYVPVSSWAGDRIIVADEYGGTARKQLPADVLAAYPDSDPDDELLRFVLENFKHVSIPVYESLGDSDAFFPNDRVWVVRNLTKKWYARSDVLVKAKNRCGPHVTSGLSLGDLIWADAGGSMSGGVGEGGAGDRFDIQELASVEGVEGWEDLSKQAKKCLSSFDMNHDVAENR